MKNTGPPSGVVALGAEGPPASIGFSASALGVGAPLIGATGANNSLGGGKFELKAGVDRLFLKGFKTCAPLRLPSPPENLLPPPAIIGGGGPPEPPGAEGGAAPWSPKLAVELFLDKSISEGGAEFATESSSSPPKFLSTHFFLSSSQTIKKRKKTLV